MRSRTAATSDLVAFRIDAPTDRRDLVRALFSAQDAYQRWREARAVVESALLAAGVLPALSLVLPNPLPALVRLLAFIAWAGVFVVAVIARAAGWRARRRMLRAADALRAAVAR